MTYRLVALVTALLLTPAAGYAVPPPVADVHTHYKWSQVDVTSAAQAVATLRTNKVALAVVIGTPADYALRLLRAAPDIVVPVWSPYEKPGDWSTWAFDRGVVARARAALQGGLYRGIGELHLLGGYAPPWHTPVISGLFELATEFDVPILLHTEFSGTGYLTGLCQAFPHTRILWAHAGGILPPQQVDAVLAACPGLSVELSARDPWRYVDHPITSADGRLLTAWRQLIAAWPERFMVGTDTVWPVERLDSWDEPDTGWQQYARFLEFHRTWLADLPPALATKVRLENARALFARRPIPRDNP